MSGFSVKTFGRALALQDRAVDLPAAGGLRLQALPGARRLQLTLTSGDTTRLRVEIPVEPKEVLHLELAQDADGNVSVHCPHHQPITLPPDEAYEPPPPISLPASPQRLDLAVLVDGTTRLDLYKSLLAEKEAWHELTEKLGVFLTRLLEHYDDARICVFAFGDQPMPDDDVRAEELLPSYLFHPPLPEDRRLRSLTVEQAVAQLRSIPSTSGGDFVDAVADGFHAAGELRWRPTARKLLLLFGDSPGHSTAHPLPPGGDICVRERDVDIEALRLHRQDVEIVTLYHDPSASKIGLEELKGRELLDGTRRQYRRLAALPETAFIASSFDPERATQTVYERPALIARGAAHGLLLEESATALTQPDSEPAVEPATPASTDDFSLI